MKRKDASKVRITALEVENLKRVRAVALECGTQALTVIGGRNAQGKTSVLDGIMWALGGDRFRPSQPVHEGADEARVRVELDNGITVERKGVSGALKVTSANGKGGQALLNEFVNVFALNLPKFMAATGLEKAKMLLEAYPDLGPKVQRLNEEIKQAYHDRLALGRIADQKAKYAAELPFDEGAPETPLSGAEMGEAMKQALAVNARNNELRARARQAAEAIQGQEYRVQSVRKRMADLEAALAEARTDLRDQEASLANANAALAAAQASSAGAKDADTKAIEAKLEEIDALNARVRANESKRNAEAEAAELKRQYADLSTRIDELRGERIRMLATLDLPLEGLSIDEEGELIFNGQRWDCMSGSEQLRVAAAICAAMKPECGFVLLDKLEAMDVETLREFGDWLDERGLQAIGTRVSTGPENSIVIEDGVVAGAEEAPEPRGKAKRKSVEF